MVICIGFITVGVMYEMMFGVIIFSFFLGLIFSAFLVLHLRKNGENKKRELTKPV
jgi:amino acid transporter